MTSGLHAMREQLPAGLPVDNLDRVLALLERETNSGSLKAKLVEWGWQLPNGEPLDWFYWWLRREQHWR